MRESRSSGSVGAPSGNRRLYPEAQRQNSITAELFDIVAGFEAIAGSGRIG